ncbi:MAG: chitobiase/beta-hexosaminidase C-terminal domain-containing protein [Lachnospiraceae bacterium]|nr:chitobiase/beta-hexosaminidase C-terminal domain-containing protein [Lachnospiraceae bacterium]
MELGFSVSGEEKATYVIDDEESLQLAANTYSVSIKSNNSYIQGEAGTIAVDADSSEITVSESGNSIKITVSDYDSEKVIHKWEFTDGEEGDFAQAFPYNSGTLSDGWFKGLKITKARTHGNADTNNSGKFAYLSDGSVIRVPVNGKSSVSVTTNYQAAGTISKTADPQEDSEKVDLPTGSGKVPYSYNEAEAGYVYIATTGTSYLENIEVTEVKESGGATGPFVTNELINFTYANSTSAPAQDTPVPSIDGLSVTNIAFHDWQHGLYAKAANATMTLNLEKKANITIQSCTHNNKTATVEATSGRVAVDRTVSDPIFTVLAAEPGELTLTFPTTAFYIHSIDVDYEGDTATGDAYEELYIVNVTSGGNGTAKADKILAKAGEDTVTLTAEADAGYTFQKWEVVKGDVTIAGNNTFTMPASDVEINAVFKLEGARFEWNFATDDELTGENGVVIENGKENATDEVYGLKIDVSATGSKWDSTASGAVSVTAGTKISVPVNGVIGESDVENKYILTVDASTDAYKVNNQAAASAGKSIFVCDATDGINIDITGANTIAYIKVAPFYYAVAGKIDFLSGASTMTDTKGLVVNNFKHHGTSHGIWSDPNLSTDDSTVVLSLAKSATVTVVVCCYGAGKDGTMTASSGTPLKPAETSEKEGNQVGTTRTLMETDAGDLTLTFDKDMYVHSITVEYPEVVDPSTRTIDVWDLAANVQADAAPFVYTNHITPASMKAANIVTSNGTLTSGTSATFGDLTMYTGSNDRFYTDIKDTDMPPTYDGMGNWGTYQAGDYKGHGGFYCNGASNGSNRNLEIANVQAGDKIVVYVGNTSNNTARIDFEGRSGAAAGQMDSYELPGAAGKKFEFVAENTGAYRIIQTTGSGKPIYYRVMRIPGVVVTGSINWSGLSVPSDYIVKFVNDTNGKETVAKVEDNKYTVTLAPGFNYTAVLSGASGYGFTASSKYIETEDAQYRSGLSGKDLVVEGKDTYTYSGKLVGFAEDYDISGLVITMLPPEESTADSVLLTIDKEERKFSAALEVGEAYTIQMKGVDDYEVVSELTINKTDDYEADIEVELKDKHLASGKFILLDHTALPVNVTELKFTILDEKGAEISNYTYEATVTNNGYSIRLRNGSYIAKATVAGESYSTGTHVVIDNGKVEKDLMFKPKSTDTSTLPFKADIYVGYSDKDAAVSYATLTEALDAVNRMTRVNNERITVHIAPGIYREQITVSASNITFVNDNPDKTVLLTWYYGIGYTYYSADAKGFYDPYRAYDQFDKNIAAKWGRTVWVTGDSFRAEGITFESSFNRYITDEEIEDGVEVDAKDFPRKYGADVNSRSAIERACAMYIEADKAEFKDCGFYSAQDTLYTPEGDYHGYFKNCVIEGNTDYICGGGDYVFDGCELSWKGYSDNKTQGGYITAARPAKDNVGYLFRNCIITANGYTVAPGYLGRNWGADAKVTFLNTKLQNANLIAAKGWDKMNGEPSESDFNEYNTTTTDGVAVDTSGRVRPILTADQAATYTAEKYFGDWIPAYYVAEAEGNVEFVENPSLSSNAKDGLAASKVGNILTVSYSLGTANDANDASIIRWYRVDGSTETLIKTTNASDKSYLITEADVGMKIKVTVTPAVSSGKSGEAASAAMESAVLEGYDETVEFSTLPSITSDGNLDIPHPGDVLTAKYSLDSANLSMDKSKIVWYRVKDGAETKITEAEAPNKTYTIADADVGYCIKVEVTPINAHGTSNEAASYTMAVAVTAKDLTPIGVEAPVANPDPREGAIDVGKHVKLSSATKGAQIYYNINSNADPTKDSATLYSDASDGIEIKRNMVKDNHVVIKAIAVAGSEESIVVTFDYTINDKSSETPETGDGSGLVVKLVNGKNYTYTGSAITPEIKVTNNSLPLTEGIDYTVKYSNNVKVTTKTPAKVTVTGKGNLSGSASDTFNIDQKSLNDSDETGLGAVEGDTVYVVSGSKATPVLSYGGVKLTTKDFDITDGKDTKWTEGKVDGITISGKNNFKDDRTLDVVVLSKEDQKKAKIKVTLKPEANQLTYNGKDQELPAGCLTVTNAAGDTLTEEEYIVSYPSDIKSAGKKKITIIGISPRCVGTVNKTYTIKPAKDGTVVEAMYGNKPVNTENTVLDFVSTGVTFNYAIAQDDFEVTYDDEAMVYGTDYKITYSGNKKPNVTAKFTIAGLGNYKGLKKTFEFKIGEASLGSENLEVIVPDKLFTKPKAFKSTPYVIETLGDGNTVLLKSSSYKVTYWKDAEATQAVTEVAAGDKVYVKLEGKGVYKDSVIITDEPYTIVDGDKDLSTAKIAFYDAAGAPKPTTKFAYTGEEVKPAKIEITFKDKAKTKVELTLGDDGRYSNDDYEVQFVNNVNKGKATVIITAKDSNSNESVGGKTATFSIVAKNLKNLTDLFK